MKRGTCFVAIIMALFLSCSKSEDDGSSNTTDIAVTGNVEKVGMSYAIVNGYVNLNLLNSEKNTVIGIEYSTHEDGGGRKQSTTSITGNKITVKLKDMIWPDTTFYYRTFVTTDKLTYYGKTKSFSTSKGFCIAQTGEVTNITSNSATISGTAKISSISQDEFLGLGIAYSKKKEELTDHISSLGNTMMYSESGYAFIGYNGIFSVNLEGLSPGTRYYYSSFNRLGVKFYFSEIKEFTTKNE